MELLADANPVRHWKKKWVAAGHMRTFKWVPVEPKRRREQAITARKEKTSRQLSDNAPVTRSITATYGKRTSSRVTRSRSGVTGKDKEEEDDDKLITNEDSKDVPMPTTPPATMELEKYDGDSKDKAAKGNGKTDNKLTELEDSSSKLDAEEEKSVEDGDEDDDDSKGAADEDSASDQSNL